MWYLLSLWAAFKLRSAESDTRKSVDGKLNITFHSLPSSLLLGCFDRNVLFIQFLPDLNVNTAIVESGFYQAPVFVTDTKFDGEICKDWEDVKRVNE